MSMEQIIDAVRGLDGALVVVPGPEGDAPELAWGDAFFYYAPDGRMPQHVQPYGTIVTKDYPDDSASDLDAPEPLAREHARRPRDVPPPHGRGAAQPHAAAQLLRRRRVLPASRCTARSAGSPS